jgi:PIN domain nuclease of toxin-antitoxin system
MGNASGMVETMPTKIVTVQAAEGHLLELIGLVEKGLDVPLDQMIRGQSSTNDLRILPVELHHVYVLDELPLHHNDPFDR